MQPRDVIRLTPGDFGSSTACLGWQLVDILGAIASAAPPLKWFCADVESVPPSPFARHQQVPSLVGDTEALIKIARDVEQFESGVFLGIPVARGKPLFRVGGLWTDDDEDADLGDALVEVRAFDTSYWVIAMIDLDIAARIREQFKK